MICEKRGFVDSKNQIREFKETISSFYQQNRRSFPWREHITSYSVVVSEIMLQQTQTERVRNKFGGFVDRFPSFQDLSGASFQDILGLWKGLGYNRRALALQKIAYLIVTDYAGQLPSDPDVLETFPHIGKATARSIIVFAYNKPFVFIETNIRTVFINFFFKNQNNVKDRDIEPLVAQTLDHQNPREWYYALMDYGVYLKKTIGNVSRQGAGYAKQSRFEGSDRQVRGQVLSLLLEKKFVDIGQLPFYLAQPMLRTEKIVQSLERDGLVKKEGNVLLLV